MVKEAIGRDTAALTEFAAGFRCLDQRRQTPEHYLLVLART